MAGPWEKYQSQSAASSGPWEKYGGKTEAPDTRGLPPGQTVPPGVPSPTLPKELQSQPEGKDMLEKLENGIHDGSFPGPNMVVNGIRQLVGSIPAFANSPTRGAADVLEGVGKTLSPAAIPAAIVAPGAAIAGLGGGALGQILSGAAAKGLGANPDTQRLVGDLGGLAGGIGGAKMAPSGRPTLPQIPPALQKAIEKFPVAGKGASSIYDILRYFLNPAETPTKPNMPVPAVTYPQRQAPVAAPPVTFADRPAPVAAPPVSFPQRPGPVAAPPVTFPAQAQPKVVPPPPVTFPSQAAPTKVVPPPPLKWLTRVEETPAGTAADAIVVKNGIKYKNVNGHLLPIGNAK